MSDSSNDETAGAILRTAASLDRPPAVSDALLAAWAEGRLNPERAALVEAHLAADDEARGFALALRDEVLSAGAGASKSDPIPSLAAARARRSTWVPFAAAAAVLVAASATFLGSRSTTPMALGSDVRLVAVADDLSRAGPDLFGDFRPIGAAERREAVADTNRSGLSILEPVGRILATQPSLRWASTAGATSYEVTIADADGLVVWSSRTDRTSVAPENGPRLDAGRSYVIEVHATGPLGRTTATRPFEIANASAADSTAKARTALLRMLGDEFGELAYAHLAARRGLLLESERAVTTYLARNAKDADARGFDAYIRRRLGWPEGR